MNATLIQEKTGFDEDDASAIRAAGKDEQTLSFSFARSFVLALDIWAAVSAFIMIASLVLPARLLCQSFAVNPEAVAMTAYTGIVFWIGRKADLWAASRN